MTLTIEVTPELENSAADGGCPAGPPRRGVLRAVLERQVMPLALCVVALPPDEQDRVMAAAAEEAAEVYNADLALPVNERELTAFTALDGEGFLDPAGDG